LIFRHDVKPFPSGGTGTGPAIDSPLADVRDDLFRRSGVRQACARIQVPGDSRVVVHAADTFNAAFAYACASAGPEARSLAAFMCWTFRACAYG
jgi:hypothetical protein